jgi:hypothetical protein
LRGVPEDVVEEIGEGGGGGKRGWNEWILESSGKYLMMRHFGVQKELPHSRFVVLFDARECSFPSRFVKAVFWQRLFSSPFGRSQESSRSRIPPLQQSRITIHLTEVCKWLGDF